MKKVTVLLILSLAICLAACGKKVSTPDEMLDVVKEKENISAEVDMIECGRIVDNDTTIVVGMTGENDKTYIIIMQHSFPKIRMENINIKMPFP